MTLFGVLDPDFTDFGTISRTLDLAGSRCFISGGDKWSFPKKSSISGFLRPSCRRCFDIFRFSVEVE